MAVSCKSWQTGFDATRILAQLRGEAPNPKRRRELQFRELWLPKWSQGFRQRLEALTGQREFTYCLAVTHVKGNSAAWATDTTISQNLAGNPFRFLPLTTMWSEVLAEVTTTPASSEIGRLAQLLKAAGLTDRYPVAPPAGPASGTAAALADLVEQGESDFEQHQ